MLRNAEKISSKSRKASSNVFMSRKLWVKFFLVLLVLQGLFILHSKIHIGIKPSKYSGSLSSHNLGKLVSQEGDTQSSNGKERNEKSQFMGVSQEEVKKIVGSGYTADSEVQLESVSLNLTENWSATLAEAPVGSTCEEWLENEDKLLYGRNYSEKPILVGYSEEKLWVDCSIGCRHISNSGDVDAQFGKSNRGVSSILRSMEPKAYYGINDAEEGRKSGYEVVMTVHLNSDVPVGYFSWEEYDIMKPIPLKDSSPGIAVAFISNCNANNFRSEAVVEIQKYVAVDSYGHCANNRPNQLDKMGTIRHYKFCLAFENSCEDDYVTEKFWQSLVAGCLPVVIGAPNIEKFSPANNSFIHWKSMDELEAIGRKINEVYENPDEWNRMMAWKLSGPSDQFKALLDMSAVHSSCRLCIHLGDRFRLAEEEKVKRKHPCRCKDSAGTTVFHIYVRERGRFYFDSIFMTMGELHLKVLERKISDHFKSQNHVPIWRSKRPAVLQSDKDMDMNVYRVYPAGSTQREALHGSASFRDSAQFRKYLEKNPCPTLEVIFI